MRHLLPLFAVLIVSAAVGGGCRVPIRAEAELGDMSCEDNSLRVTVNTWTLAANPFSGPKRERFNQYLLTYKTPPNTEQPQYCLTRQLPSSSDLDADTANQVVIAPSGRSAVRISNEHFVIINKKGYATASLDVLRADPESGRWTIARTYSKRPFLLSPSANHLVIYENGRARAIDLQALRDIDVPRLNELFDAAGASWVSDLKDPSYSADWPPDFLGLTDDFDYASADRGEVYSHTLFEHSTGRKTDLFSCVQPAGDTRSFDLLMVRRAPGGWRYLCQTDQGRTLAVLDDQLRVLATAPEIFRSPLNRNLIEWQWNADAGVIVLYQRCAPIADHPITARIWRYAGASPSTKDVQLDLNTRFRLSDYSYVPAEKK